MKLLLLALLGLSTTLVSVNSKSQYIVKEDRKVKTPKLQAYDDSWCLFKDGTNHACLDNSIQIEAG